MLNIGVDIERLRNLNSGLGQFCWHLATNLQSIKSTPKELHFYYPKNFSNYIKNAKIHTVSFLDKLLGVRNKQLQLFHCTHQDSHLFSNNTSTILTIHDLNFLEKYTHKAKQQQKLKVLQQKINKVKGITFISNYTKELVQQHLTLPNIPTRVIYNGNCLNQSIEAIKPDITIEANFIFTIGIVNPKKNFHVLLPLIKETDYRLVIAGNKTNSYAQEILNQAEQLGVSHKIILLGAVTENEKLWLYQHCKAFVFPSLAEGFGLPVIEAMSVGKPVFLSNKTSLPEVGGTLAYYWENFESAHMVEVFKKGLLDYETNSNKKEELITWSAQFNWQKTANDYLDFYNEVYNQK